MRKIVMILLCLSLLGCANVFPGKRLLEKDEEIRKLQKSLFEKEQELQKKDSRIEKLRKKLEGFGVFEKKQ